MGHHSSHLCASLCEFRSNESAWGFSEDRKVWKSKESSKDEGGLVRWPSWCRCFPLSLKT